MSELYKVTIGQDVYLGTAEEVVQFMARAEGAPGDDLPSFMQGVAERVEQRLAVTGIPTDDPQEFLEALQEKRIARVEVQGMPSDEMANPDDVLGDGPLAFGPDVDPRDIDVG